MTGEGVVRGLGVTDNSLGPTQKYTSQTGATFATFTAPQSVTCVTADVPVRAARGVDWQMK